MVKDLNELIYHAVPGGNELVRWFGQVPTFHDAEILSLRLCSKGKSELRLHGWVWTGKVAHGGQGVLDRHAIVTFALEGVMDLQFDGFSHQNVILSCVVLLIDLNAMAVPGSAA